MQYLIARDDHGRLAAVPASEIRRACVDYSDDDDCRKVWSVCIEQKDEEMFFSSDLTEDEANAALVAIFSSTKRVVVLEDVVAQVRGDA